MRGFAVNPFLRVLKQFLKPNKNTIGAAEIATKHSFSGNSAKSSQEKLASATIKHAALSMS